MKNNDLDLLQDISNDIDTIDFNKKPTDFNKTIEFSISEIEMSLYYGIPLSELSYRQTGRTSKMIEIICEDVRLHESMKKNRNILIVSPNMDMGRDIMRQIFEKISSNVMYIFPKLQRSRIKIDYCEIYLGTFSKLKMGEYLNFDEIYFDNSCWDLEERKIRNMFIRREKKNDRRT